MSFQCSRCLEVLSADAGLSGRKLICPMCEQVNVVPPYDPARVLVEQNLSTALEHFRVSDWDRLCARKVLELKLADPAALHLAITSIRRQARHAEPIALNDELLRRKLIDYKTSMTLRELVSASLKPGSVTFKECPNCFEMISSSKSVCPYCELRLDDIELYVQCANCKRRQPSGEICSVCGADVKTGLKREPRIKHCPRCRYELRGDYRHCPSCNVKLDFYILRTLGTHLQRVVGELSEYTRLLMIPVVLLALLYAWNRREYIGAVINLNMKGAAQATFDDQLKRFDVALRYSDYRVLNQIIDPSERILADDSLRLIILGAGESVPRTAAIEGLTHEPFVFEDDETKVTVYTHVRLNIPAPKKDLDISLPQVSAFNVATEPVLSSHVTWKFVRRDGIWYFTSPLKR
ncbi:MAG TPA: zinc ribbon domain-containing protein [Planctomycetota bacterium]|nr:zinc ribbon domain-containing protein [Planctomycetota bacterium]